MCWLNAVVTLDFSFFVRVYYTWDHLSFMDYELNKSIMLAVDFLILITVLFLWNKMHREVLRNKEYDRYNPLTNDWDTANYIIFNCNVIKNASKFKKVVKHKKNLKINFFLASILDLFFIVQVGLGCSVLLFLFFLRFVEDFADSYIWRSQAKIIRYSFRKSC